MGLDTKPASMIFAQDMILMGIEMGKLQEDNLRAIYQAALKTPGSRELSVEEAEQIIRPYELASDKLTSKIEKSLHSKP